MTEPPVGLAQLVPAGLILIELALALRAGLAGDRRSAMAWAAAAALTGAGTWWLA